MDRLNLRRDGFVLGLLLLMLVLVASGLSGAYRVFGYTLVVFLGMVSALGFVRRADAVTWLPPVLATTVLLVAFAGMFATDDAVVRSAADTVLGFQPGTAFLIYGVWLPSFVTLGVTFTLLFDRLADDGRGSRTEAGRE
jgi:hypothetical protein